MKKYYKTHVKIDSMHIGGHMPEAVIARALLKKFSGVSRPVLIAVGGPGGIGKSTFACALARELGQAAVLTLDDYKAPREERARKNIYGPHPQANQIDLALAHLQCLRDGKEIEKPVYCRDRGGAHDAEKFKPAPFVIVEGEISTYKEFFPLIDFSIFMDSHWKTQLNTRIRRDIEERGYTPKKAIAAFLYSNLHEFEEYGADSKNWADVHIHCGEDYALVIDAVCSRSLSFMIDEVSADLAEAMANFKT